MNGETIKEIEELSRLLNDETIGKIYGERYSELEKIEAERDKLERRVKYLEEQLKSPENYALKAEGSLLAEEARRNNLVSKINGFEINNGQLEIRKNEITKQILDNQALIDENKNRVADLQLELDELMENMPVGDIELITEYQTAKLNMKASIKEIEDMITSLQETNVSLNNELNSVKLSQINSNNEKERYEKLLLNFDYGKTRRNIDFKRVNADKQTVLKLKASIEALNSREEYLSFDFDNLNKILEDYKNGTLNKDNAREYLTELKYQLEGTFEDETALKNDKRVEQLDKEKEEINVEIESLKRKLANDENYRKQGLAIENGYIRTEKPKLKAKIETNKLEINSLEETVLLNQLYIRDYDNQKEILRKEINDIQTEIRMETDDEKSNQLIALSNAKRAEYRKLDQEQQKYILGKEEALKEQEVLKQTQIELENSLRKMNKTYGENRLILNSEQIAIDKDKKAKDEKRLRELKERLVSIDKEQEELSTFISERIDKILNNLENEFVTQDVITTGEENKTITQTINPIQAPPTVTTESTLGQDKVVESKPKADEYSNNGQKNNILGDTFKPQPKDYQEYNPVDRAFDGQRLPNSTVIPNTERFSRPNYGENVFDILRENLDNALNEYNRKNNLSTTTSESSDDSQDLGKEQDKEEPKKSQSFIRKRHYNFDEGFDDEHEHEAEEGLPVEEATNSDNIKNKPSLRQRFSNWCHKRADEKAAKKALKEEEKRSKGGRR